MIRQLASRMPAQKAVMRPTGPAPITVTSRISESSAPLAWAPARSGAPPFPCWVICGSGQGRGHCHGLAVEGVECALYGGRDAGEDRRLGSGVRARLGAAELVHQIEELTRVVGVERDQELLVVQTIAVGGVDLDRRVAAAGLDVAAHDPHPLLVGEPVPLALLPHRIDD